MDSGATVTDSFVNEAEFINSKAFLLTSSTKSGLNLYDHLAKVLTRVLEERQENVVDVFEDISADQKKIKFTPDGDTIQEKLDRTTEVALAEIHTKLFSKPGDDAEGGAAAPPPPVPEDVGETPLPNLLELWHYFEQGSVGLSCEEFVRVWLAMKQLVESYPLQRIRFWGKVLGLEQNYYVVEAEFREGEEPEEEQPEEAAAEEGSDSKRESGMASGLGSEGMEGMDGEGEPEADPIPKPNFKPPPVIPKEEKGAGCNKRSYFVCNEPGKVWIRLPQVTPAQIQAARKVRKYFTGRLNAHVSSYPPFPGNEANYLRAQISRVSAGTQISPLGLYQFDEEEEEPEEGGGRTNYVDNEDFQGLSLQELLDPLLPNWVHHVQHILPQGRTAWWNPSQKGEEEAEEDEEGEEAEEADEPQPEAGPPLLTPLSEDSPIDNMPAWTPQASTHRVPQYSIAVLHSNLWPGAHAFAVPNKKLFENVYVGWGIKYASENFTPAPPGPILEEFPSGPETTEIDDPTPEEEAAFRAAQMKAEEGGEEGAEEGAEEAIEGDADED